MGIAFRFNRAFMSQGHLPNKYARMYRIVFVQTKLDMKGAGKNHMLKTINLLVGM